MRNKDVLLQGFDDIKILMQYLYMSEEHSVLIHNSINVPLRITMDENMEIWCKNEHFPDIPPMRCTNDFGPQKALDIVEVLKSEPAIEFPDTFKNRWEEIKTMTLNNLALNL